MYFYIGSIDRRTRTVHSCDKECLRGRALSVVLVVVVRLLDDARPFGEVEGAAHGDGSGRPPGQQNALQLANPIPLIFLQNVHFTEHALFLTSYLNELQISPFMPQ